MATGFHSPQVQQGNGSLDSPTANDLVARGDTMQQVRTSYATAVSVQRPRDLAQVQRSFLNEARLAGEAFYYGWGAGKNHIEGVGINGAMALARCWGNCAVEALPVQDMGDSWVFTSSFVDLETGFTVSRQFRQSKASLVHGNHDDERKDDIRFQIGQSKSARNVVLNALPKWLADKALNEAKAGVREEIEQKVGKHGIAKVIDGALKSLARCGVKEDAVLQKLEIADRKAIDLDMLVMLKGDLFAIESGQDWAENLFPGCAPGVKSRAKKTTLGETPDEAYQPSPDDEPAGGSEPEESEATA